MSYNKVITRAGGSAALLGVLVLLSACDKTEPAGNQVNFQPPASAPAASNLSPQELVLRAYACDTTLRSANNPAVTGRLPADLAKAVQEAPTFDLMTLRNHAKADDVPADKAAAAHREGRLGPTPNDPLGDDYVSLLRECVAVNAQLAKAAS